MQGPAGVGISEIKQTTTSNVAGGSNVWTVTLSNGVKSTLTVKNGTIGPQGPTGPAGGIRDVAASATKGYITVTKADNTTKEIQVGDPNALLKSGGTMTGVLTIAEGTYITGPMGGGTDWWLLQGTGADDLGVLELRIADNLAQDYFDIIFDNHDGATSRAIRFGGSSINAYVPFYGAVWNDYAEYREANTTEPGRVVYELGDDTLSLTNSRMMPACSIISDTYGFAIGKTEKCKTPLAQAGRVLAYPLEDRYSYKPGDAVCSGPNGTVSKMTQEEKVNYPECIIGYVSCVPDYEVWGEHDTKVNGRIWIKVV